MKIVQMIKKLNNTELGKGGTHDTYVLVPNDLDISDIFDTPGAVIDFVDKQRGNHVGLRNTVGREKRIVGLGQYYRENDLSAGDEIVFERVESGDNIRYFITIQKYDESLVVQKSKYGFEILTPERLAYFNEICQNAGALVEINFVTAEKKRNDSPEETNFYDILVNGTRLLSSCGGKEIKELYLSGRNLRVTSFYGWKKYAYEMED